ncbi:hypothetical protein SDC9_50604 [bioreactor metagenome]|uniref:Uncharacterized protein n=1 Tax=bioreactor metagenome TaxID=1076179 RepID=A0A644WL69_9ZZZZ
MGVLRALFRRGDHLVQIFCNHPRKLRDLLRRLVALLGELPHFLRHHGEAPSCLTGPGGLDGGVEGQQIGLVGDAADLGHEALDLPGTVAEFPDLFRSLFRFRRYAGHAGHHFFDSGHALFTGGPGVLHFGGHLRALLGRGLGAARHFLHGGVDLLACCGQAFHLGGDVVDACPGLFDPGVGFLREGGELLGVASEALGGFGNGLHGLPELCSHLAEGAGYD